MCLRVCLYFYKVVYVCARVFVVAPVLLHLRVHECVCTGASARDCARSCVRACMRLCVCVCMSCQSESLDHARWK